MCEEEKGYTCYWRIENFILRNSNPNLYLRSPDFQADCLNSHWYILMQQKQPGFIGIYLFRKSHMKKIKVRLSISFLKSTGWETILDKCPSEFKMGAGNGVHELVSWLNIANDEWTYLPCGSLTVSLHLFNEDLADKRPAQWLIISRMTSGNMDLKHLPIQKFRDLIPKHLLNFPASYKFDTEKTFTSIQTTEADTSKDSDEVTQILKKNDLSFVTLRTKHKEFSVLKTVLCAKSSVFKAMFEGRMKESSSNIVDIEDIDSDTISLLIKYLHFQPIFSNLDWNEAVKLYYAADKYQIVELKESCLCLLETMMSIETVCDAFVFADMHQDKEFLKNAQEFFSENSKLILKSEEWTNFVLNHTKLASEILCKFADKM